MRKRSLSIIGLILIAFALRWHGLGAHSLWYDELLELDIAQGPFSEIKPQLPRHAAMPLDYYLLYGWVRLGRQEAWVRFPALFFGVLAIPLVYVLGRRLFNRRTGLIAAALLACSAFAVDYSQEARPYALLLFLTALTYFGLWQLYETGRRRYWLLVLAGLAGAALTHYFSLFMLLPLGLFVGLHQLYHFKQKKIWQNTALFILMLLVLVAIFGLYGRLGVLRSVGGRYATVVSQPEALAAPASEKPNRGTGPPRTAEFFLESILMPLSTAASLYGLLLYNAFFLSALFVLLQPRRQTRKAVLLLLAWLILPLILIYTFLLQRGTFFAIRYILYTLPAYLLLVAYGIDRLTGLVIKSGVWLLNTDENGGVGRAHAPDVAGRGWAASLNRLFSTEALQYALAILALYPLILAQSDQLFAHYAADSREDWRAVGQLLWAEANPDDAVIAVKAEPAINWYYPPAAAPFGAFWGTQPIWQAINRHPRRWFVLSSYSYRRDEGLRDWLADQQAIKIVLDRRVILYFHQEGQTGAEMLAQVKQFALPQKPATYAGLAGQFRQYGDLETSRTFYQKAIELARTPAQRAEYESELAALLAPDSPVSQ